MEEFLKVNLGNILTILTFIAGGSWFMSNIRTSVDAQSGRLENVEEEIYELRKVVVAMARQEERMTAMDQRMLLQGKRIDRMENGPT